MARCPTVRILCPCVASGRADDGQHLAVGSGEHVPVYGAPAFRKRQLPSVLLTLETASHHAGEILFDSSDLTLL